MPVLDNFGSGLAMTGIILLALQPAMQMFATDRRFRSRTGARFTCHASRLGILILCMWLALLLHDRLSPPAKAGLVTQDLILLFASGLILWAIRLHRRAYRRWAIYFPGFTDGLARTRARAAEFRETAHRLLNEPLIEVDVYPDRILIRPVLKEHTDRESLGMITNIVETWGLTVTTRWRRTLRGWVPAWLRWALWAYPAPVKKRIFPATLVVERERQTYREGFDALVGELGPGSRRMSAEAFRSAACNAVLPTLSNEEQNRLLKLAYF